jgi:2-polyprenyl-6-hydroxyphenyl methylase / 3-demethylubiquinone-9 3-methyltransferase
MAAAVRIELDATTPDAIDGRQIRAVTFEQVRMQYLQRTLDRAGLAAPGATALVVGGGRGILPRTLARLGFEVVAVDQSETTTRIAQEASREEGLAVTHRTASAEEPGVAAGGFDLVYCADTFEITGELDRVVEQAARALKPGGLLIYDTVNRTLLSRLVYLGAFQALPMTRIMPAGRYSADRLRRPADLAETLGRHGLRNQDVCGFKPQNPRGLIKAVLRRRRGKITDEEAAALAGFVLDPRHAPVTYLGYATKD